MGFIKTFMKAVSEEDQSLYAGDPYMMKIAREEKQKELDSYLDYRNSRLSAYKAGADALQGRHEWEEVRETGNSWREMDFGRW